MRLQKLIFLILALCIFQTPDSKSQEPLKQTVRGIVIDKQTQMPVIGASIIVRNSDPLIGSVSDIDGKYKISGAPIGRLTIECSFIGYHSLIFENVILSSAKEMVLNFELEAKSFALGEVVISSYTRKDQPVNRMSVISTRSFTPEETNRYAGSYGDPARMASNYAGVMTGRDNRNDIIIRGNSSMGIIWKLDDIEISNPSHYAALGTTGGPITILNSNLLTNSDFLSGAFPAEFGNALAGVFDLKMRNGNNEKREYWLQTGWNGLEFGTEGPISPAGKSSYIVSYRYSILEILNYFGVNLGIDPKYQDLNLKLNFPYNKGRLNIIGLGGTSSIQIFDSEKKQENWMFDEGGEDISNSSEMGLLAASNLFFFTDRSRLKTIVSVSGSNVMSQVDTFSLQQMTPFLKAGEKSSEIKYSFSNIFKKVINSKNDFDVGFTYDIYDISYSDSTLRGNNYIKDTDADETMHFYRIFGQYQYKVTDLITLITGINYQMLLMNHSQALEPRMALKWELNEFHSLNAGFGVHSQMQPRMIYFVQTQQADGSFALSNRDLKFSKSRHYVIGHDYLIRTNLRLKTELYYQQLFNIPVKQNTGAFSIINAGVEYFVGRQDSLVNSGTGRNYGLEVTLEKFFSKQYFFLITASLFNSEYAGSDNIVRPTAFNTNYLLNLVGGYEKIIGKKKNGVLVLGLRFTWNGGRPYVPFDVEGTLASGTEIMDWDNAYSKRYKDYVRSSIRIGIRRNKLKTSSELTFDLQYRTHYTNIYIERIDVNTGKIHNYQSMGFYPMTSWKLNF